MTNNFFQNWCFDCNKINKPFYKTAIIINNEYIFESLPDYIKKIVSHLPIPKCHNSVVIIKKTII